MRKVFYIVIVIVIFLCDGCTRKSFIENQDFQSRDALEFLAYEKAIGANNPEKFYNKHRFLPVDYVHISDSVTSGLKFIGRDSISISVGVNRVSCSYKVRKENKRFLITEIIQTCDDNPNIYESITNGNKLGYFPSLGDTIFASEDYSLLWLNNAFYHAEEFNHLSTMTWRTFRLNDNKK